MSAKTLRRKCKHPFRVVSQTWGGVVMRDYCPDCGAEFPIRPADG